METLQPQDVRQELLHLIRMTKTLLQQYIERGEQELPLGTLSLFRPRRVPPMSLDELYRQIQDCQRCRLGATRTHLVFGVGNPHAEVMFIGEAPGQEEDQQGVPFVGAAGQLLSRIIQAIRLKREEVYIANIIKCRPPGNRDPLPDEIDQCEPYLIQQIQIIRPKIICALGRIAGQVLLKTSASLSTLRGKVHWYQGIKVIVTYHPAALLRHPQWKRPTWEDVKFLRREYDGVNLEG